MSLHGPTPPFDGSTFPFPGTGGTGRVPPPPPKPDGLLMAGLMDRVTRFFGGGSGRNSASSPAVPQVFLAGFGKHPGAGDHDDIGVDTEQLSDVKRTLYTNGIAGNIDSGEWDRLAAGDRIEKFGHEFLWDRRNWLFYGRLWASVDAKGRARYPMVVCAQCGGVARDWVLSAVPPALARAEAGCMTATSSPEVHQLIEGLQAELRASATASVGRPAPPDGPAAKPYDFLADHPDLGPDGRGLLRLMYEVEKEMVGFRPADSQSTQTTILRMSARLRVPACGLPPPVSTDLWVAALRPLLHPSTSILAVRPLADDWVDLIVGEPTKNELYALLAGRKRAPLATEVPYELTEKFVARARQTIATQRRRSQTGIPVAAGSKATQA
jgi:hypothetical protein